ncbi:hypothetical protein NEOLEDRAFT_1138020 [Neolentinus lepideus HHB14362 ss-1]|uniref:Uncharacterized protein n=1 Tax=Neolentinus lepideus HHB14362 ss-1 TaxID=1314782 RepID=A0A165QF93_9AGAM|nr:hypothetical protein NEOLEDRAFT_1138020 [Neolentinus lepideus HHB14362 ss-1]
MSVAAGIPLLGRFISSLLARWLPGMGFEPIRPVQLQPLYLPGWLVDAEIVATGWITTGEEESEQYGVIARMSNSYMPGHSLEPISRICLNDPRLYELENVPWSSELETQYGLQPLCLPYTMSPLGLLDLLRTLPYRDGYVNETFRFEPRSVQANLFAAYPILIPVYLARYQYKFGDATFSLTVLHEAHHQDGRVISENTVAILGKSISERGVDPWILGKKLLNPAFLVWNGSSVPFSNIEFLSVASPRHEPRDQLWLVNGINEWANTLADTPESFKRLAQHKELQKIGMDDLRVRVYTDEEVLANRSWMATGLKLLKLQNILHTMKDADLNRSGSYVISVGTNKDRSKSDDETSKGDSSKLKNVGPVSIVKSPITDVLKEFESKLEKATTEREEKKPEWLKRLHAKEKDKSSR